ncbi:MAG: EamA family transporter [Actinomycetota bacterium]|nr:EamA family transporter [Actinomycetota bacterium]
MVDDSLLLALSAAIAWGASDFLGGITTRAVSVVRVLAVSQSCGLVVISVVFLASGARFPSGIAILEASLAGVAAVVALGMLYVALAIGRSAMVGPIAASGVIVPVVVGLVEGNTLTLVTTAGMVLAGVGIFCSGWEEPSEHRGDKTRRRRPVVVALAVGAALTTGAYLTLIKAASASSSLGTIEVLKVTATACALLVLFVVDSSTQRRRLRSGATLSTGDSAGLTRRRLRWVLVAAVGIADVVAEVLYATSTVHGQLSIVSMISGLYPVVTIGLFVAIYKERVNGVQLVGAVVAIAGLSLIAIGVG